MATKVLVNGKFQTRPGVYATIKSGVKNPSPSQPYGNILIIDDGIGGAFIGGSGINGQFNQGANSVYKFDSLADFKAFTKGGALWNLSTPLFRPSGNLPGVASVYLIQAATTTAAEKLLTLTNTAFTIQAKDEGTSGNGVLAAGGNLSLGYASKLIQVNIPTAVATFITSITQAAGVGVPEKHTVIATNINVNDVFTIVVAGVTFNKTAATTLTADLYTQFIAAINVNATVIAANLSAAIVGGNLVISSSVNNVPFTQTSSVVAAPAQFVYQIWGGTYKGLDTVNNVPYDTILDVNATPQLILQSPVVTLAADLITWFQNNSDFNTGFALKAGWTATGNIVVTDVTNNPGYGLFAGGTEVYGAGDFDAALAVINNLDFTHILATGFGTNATNLNNSKLFDFVANVSKYERILVVGGGYDKTSFVSGTGSSSSTTLFYNSDKVVVVHGGVKKVVRGGAGFNIYNQLYKAAQILGRVAGLPSQVPVTLKTINIDGEVHLLSDDEQEYALSKGIMYSYYDYELKSFVAGQGINSLQNNEYLINADSTSFNWALKRISAELNKTIIVAGKIRFFGGNAGGNRNSTSPEEVVSWAIGLLLQNTANSLQDGLIISAKNVRASVQQDNLKLEFDFVGNTEISKIISTGTLIEG